MPQFLHGVEMLEVDSGSRAITTSKSAVIGLIGTAPDSAAAVAATLTKGSAVLNDGLLFTAVTAGAGGNAISVIIVDPEDVSQALSVSVDVKKITVSLATDADGALVSTATEVAALINADAAAKLLVLASVLGDGSGDVAPSSRAYLTGGENEPFPVGVPVAVAGDVAMQAKLGTAGTLYNAFDDIFDQKGALVIAVRVEEGSTDAETQANVILGMQAWLDSQTVTGYKPRILVAPEWSQYDGVAAEMESKAARLRAIAYLDCDVAATYTDAIKRARNYGARVEMLWPWVTVYDTDQAQNVNRPYSGRAAGLRARIDDEKGFWWSKSNQSIYGIVGTAVAVDWSLGDAESLANMLNENKVSTIINEGGWLHWGNRTCATDPKWTFEQSRRTADIIMDSIQTNHMWAVDRNITKTYADEVVEGVNDYMRSLKSEGALFGGKCWLPSGVNSVSNMTQGIVYFDFDFCGPYPAEHIIFRSYLNNGYVEEVFS